MPEIELKRCFTTVDLVSLGVATIVGGGLYVTIGEMARDTASVAAILYSGAQTSTNFHNVITAINLIVIGFIVIFGVFSELCIIGRMTSCHRIQGVLQGAATAFFAFSGFDTIA